MFYLFVNMSDNRTETENDMQSNQRQCNCDGRRLKNLPPGCLKCLKMLLINILWQNWKCNNILKIYFIKVLKKQKTSITTSKSPRRCFQISHFVQQSNSLRYSVWYHKKTSKYSHFTSRNQRMFGINSLKIELNQLNHCSSKTILNHEIITVTEPVC